MIGVTHIISNGWTFMNTSIFEPMTFGRGTQTEKRTGRGNYESAYFIIIILCLLGCRPTYEVRKDGYSYRVKGHLKDSGKGFEIKRIR